MTREDAVTTLKDISEMVHKQKEIEKSTLYGILDSNNEPIEALDMAIKALEQELCDCISREEVCDYIAEFVNHEYATDREREMVKHIIGGIQHLPSIQPKTGHWIPVSERLPEDFQRVLVTIVNYKGDKVVRVAEYYNRKGVFQIKENHEQWEVGEKGLLAWMPLPESYKSESEE